jgi:RNA polymerase sigma-70 factor, ECF subfamily
MQADADARSDQELVAAHVRGDQNAFGELFRRHRDRLWSVAIRTIGDPEEAADALQDAMVAALRGAAGFRGDSAVTTWLHRVVVNACLDRMRRRAARPVGVAPVDSDHHPGAADPGPDPMETRELRLTLSSALATLPFEQRAALVLVDMEGYPVEEAARILDVPPGTVKSRCARARVKLIPLLADLRGGSEPQVTGSRDESRTGQRNQERRANVQGPEHTSATTRTRLPVRDGSSTAGDGEPRTRRRWGVRGSHDIGEHGATGEGGGAR